MLIKIFAVLISIFSLYSCLINDRPIESIETLNPEMKVLTPAGNSLFKNGEKCLISWEAFESDSVSIDLYMGEELQKHIIKTGTGSGSYNWTVDRDVAIGAGYSIRVTMAGNSFFSGEYAESGLFLIDTADWQTLPAIDRTAAGQASLCMPGEGIYPWVSLLHSTGETSSTAPLLLNLIENRWMDSRENTFAEDSDFFLFELNSTGQPVILSQDVAADDKTVDHYFGIYNIDRWQNISEFTYQREAEAAEFALIASMAAIPLAEKPVIIILSIPSNLLAFLMSNFQSGRSMDSFFLYVYSLRWDTNGGLYQQSGEPVEKIGAGIVLDYLDEQKIFFPELYPSTAINSAGNPVIALVNPLEDHAVNNPNKIYCYEQDGSDWDMFKPAVSEGVADSPSIVVDKADNPVIIYRDVDNNGKQKNYRVRVKRRDGAGWEDLKFWESAASGFGEDHLCSSGDAFPAIALDRNGNIIAAYTTGIYRYTGSAWECLGFPNYPGYTGKKTKKWLAVNDEAIAVCYITDEDPDRVQVKVLEY